MVPVKTAGERVRAMRVARGMSQTQLAAEMGCSQPNLANIESRDAIAQKTAMRLSQLLECPAAWLLWGQGELPTAITRMLARK